MMKTALPLYAIASLLALASCSSIQVDSNRRADARMVESFLVRGSDAFPPGERQALEAAAKQRLTRSPRVHAVTWTELETAAPQQTLTLDAALKTVHPDAVLNLDPKPSAHAARPAAAYAASVSDVRIGQTVWEAAISGAPESLGPERVAEEIEARLTRDGILPNRTLVAEPRNAFPLAPYW